MLRLAKTAIPLVALFALTACMETDASPSIDGSYRLVSIDGSAIQGSADMKIEGKSVTGQGPCNRYMATNSAEWPEVALGGVGSTRRMCVIEGGEAQFFAALAQVTRSERSGDTMELIGPDHRLKFSVE